MPNPRASSGTITTPPPSPVKAPKNPATSAPTHTIRVNVRIFTRCPPRDSITIAPYMPLMCSVGWIPTQSTAYTTESQAASLSSWVAIEPPQEIGSRYHSHAKIYELKERGRFCSDHHGHCPFGSGIAAAVLSL